MMAHTHHIVNTMNLCKLNRYEDPGMLSKQKDNLSIRESLGYQTHQPRSFIRTIVVTQVRSRVVGIVGRKYEKLKGCTQH